MTTQLPTTVRAAHLDRYGSPAQVEQRDAVDAIDFVHRGRARGKVAPVP